MNKIEERRKMYRFQSLFLKEINIVRINEKDNVSSDSKLAKLSTICDRSKNKKMYVDILVRYR